MIFWLVVKCVIIRASRLSAVSGRVYARKSEFIHSWGETSVVSRLSAQPTMYEWRQADYLSLRSMSVPRKRRILWRVPRCQRRLRRKLLEDPLGRAELRQGQFAQIAPVPDVSAKACCISCRRSRTPARGNADLAGCVAKRD